MIRLGAWLLAGCLSLAAGVAQADLRLVLDSRTLDTEQRAASQALLDEAMAALPPRLVQSLDREVRVQWRDNLPEQAYGRAGGNRLQLNRRLLPTLTDGSAALVDAIARRKLFVASGAGAQSSARMMAS